MWCEYIRMELGFIENLRRRWNILGIDADDKSDKGACVTDSDRFDVAYGIDETIPRRDIMGGMIVKSVMANAVQGASVYFANVIFLDCI
jgi:U3 small nucleolar RNA-associated protein 6